MKNWSLIVLLGLIFTFGLATWPTYKQVKTLTKENARLTVQKSQLTTEFKNLQTQSQAKPEPGENQYEAIELGYDQKQFLEDIEAIIRKNGFAVNQFSFSIGYNDELKSAQINASFGLEGARTNIFNFLVDVEKNQRFMGLNSFALESNAQNGRSQLGVSLYSFFQEQS